MYAIHVRFKDGRIQTINKTTLREAFLCYSEWKKDSRIEAVSLYATAMVHLTSYHARLDEEEEGVPTVLAGRGDGSP